MREQKIIRTASDSTPDAINRLLQDGWIVVSVMPIGNKLEYVVEKQKTTQP